MTTFLAAPTVNIKSVHLAELRKLLQSNRENHERQKYFWNVIVSVARRKPIRHEKTETQVCGFVASLHVLIFAVIGHNKHPFHISSVHGFPGHTVRLDFFDSIC